MFLKYGQRKVSRDINAQGSKILSEFSQLFARKLFQTYCFTNIIITLYFWQRHNFEEIK